MVTALTDRHPDSQMAVTAAATMYLSDTWGIPVAVQEWDQNRATHHFSKATKSHRISYSQKMVRHCYDLHFIEYPSLQRAVPNCNGKGWYGVYLLVTHEFAHAVQCTIPNGRPDGSCHNRCFVDSLAKIRTQWSYAAFCTRYNIINDKPEYVPFTREVVIMGVRDKPAVEPIPYVAGKLMVTLSEAARYTGVRYQQLYQMLQKGRFQKFGQYVDLNEIRRWSQTRTRRAA